MKKRIIDNLQENFKALQQERQAAGEKVATLTARLQEHRQRIEDQQANIKRLESEISETVSAGGDPSALLRKLRSSRDALQDLRSVVDLAERAVELAKAGQTEHVKAMSELYQKAVIKARNEITEHFQTELDNIIGKLDVWHTVALDTAEELGLPAPAAGTEIILNGLR